MDRCFHKYLKRINKKIKKPKNSELIAITGVTGSIGKAAASYLAYLGNDLIFLVRDEKRGNELKKELENEFKVNIKVLYLDYLDLGSINRAILDLEEISKERKIDGFINVNGIYRQKDEEVEFGENLSFRKTFLVNTFAPIYLINNLLKINEDMKIEVVTSLTYHHVETNLLDLECKNVDWNLTKIYAHSKRVLMDYLMKLKEEKNINLRFVHPGVSTTNLFSKKNKAYGSWFYKICPPLMKIIFMNPYKASLSILLGYFDESNDDVIYGPKIFAEVYGYPKKYSLNKNFIKIVDFSNVFNEINVFLEDI